MWWPMKPFNTLKCSTLLNMVRFLFIFICLFIFIYLFTIIKIKRNYKIEIESNICYRVLHGPPCVNVACRQRVNSRWLRKLDLAGTRLDNYGGGHLRCPAVVSAKSRGAVIGQWIASNSHTGRCSSRHARSRLYGAAILADSSTSIVLLILFQMTADSAVDSVVVVVVVVVAAASNNHTITLHLRRRCDSGFLSHRLIYSYKGTYLNHTRWRLGDIVASEITGRENVCPSGDVVRPQAARPPATLSA